MYILSNLRIHNNTGHVQRLVVQPITDAADVTGRGFAMRPLTSYNNNYYYITLLLYPLSMFSKSTS